MIAWLESLPTSFAGVVIVGGFVVLALILGLAVTRYIPQEVRTAHNDRAGFILAVIGVIYAVLLAFVAVGVWERFETAEARTYETAGAIATVYRDAASFPQAARVRSLLRAYVKFVIDDDWPKMQRGDRPSIVNPMLEEADHLIRAMPVNSPGLAGIHLRMLTAMDTVIVDRETRLTIDSGGINSVLWLVLVAGAFITVAFTYLFGFDRTLMQLLMIGGLSLLIGLMLFLIMALDYPFRGTISVEPEAFRTLLESFGAIGA